MHILYFGLTGLFFLGSCYWVVIAPLFLHPKTVLAEDFEDNAVLSDLGQEKEEIL